MKLFQKLKNLMKYEPLWNETVYEWNGKTPHSCTYNQKDNYEEPHHINYIVLDGDARYCKLIYDNGYVSINSFVWESTYEGIVEQLKQDIGGSDIHYKEDAKELIWNWYQDCFDCIDKVIADSIKKEIDKSKFRGKKKLKKLIDDWLDRKTILTARSNTDGFVKSDVIGIGDEKGKRLD